MGVCLKTLGSHLLKETRTSSSIYTSALEAGPPVESQKRSLLSFFKITKVALESNISGNQEVIQRGTHSVTVNSLATMDSRIWHPKGPG